VWWLSEPARLSDAAARTIDRADGARSPPAAGHQGRAAARLRAAARGVV